MLHTWLAHHLTNYMDFCTSIPHSGDTLLHRQPRNSGHKIGKSQRELHMSEKWWTDPTSVIFQLSWLLKASVLLKIMLAYSIFSWWCKNPNYCASYQFSPQISLCERCFLCLLYLFNGARNSWYLFQSSSFLVYFSRRNRRITLHFFMLFEFLVMVMHCHCWGVK